MLGDIESMLLNVLEPHSYFTKCIEEKKEHGDGRPLGKFRDVHLSTSVISTSDGSASVEMGDTYVVCSVKVDLAEPAPNSRNCGAVILNLLLSEECHGKRMMEEAKAALQDAMPFIIKPEMLCIINECLCWVLYIDISILSNCGGLLDASLLAIIAALRQVRLPQLMARNSKEDISIKNVQINEDEPRYELQLTPWYPVACTFLPYDADHLLCDPTLEESLMFRCDLSVLIGAGDRICGLFKYGGLRPLSRSTIAECIAIAKSRRRQLLAILGIVDEEEKNLPYSAV